MNVIWDTALAERVRDLPETRAKITRAAYARLFLPEILPESIDRVLYLDTDTMARRCVGDLFFSDMQVSPASASRHPVSLRDLA